MSGNDAHGPAIFISYRREDSEGHAGRLYKDLAEQFGAGRVFMDVTGIEPGRDFRRVIDEQVATCAVLLAVIGRDWVDARDEQGRRKLDDPGDFVRLETVAALRRDIPVVPVLVQGASMPHLDQLPDELKPLAFRNAVELTHPRWDSDLKILIKALAPYLGNLRDAAHLPSAAPRARPRLRLAGILAGALALAAAIGGWQLWLQDRSRAAQAGQVERERQADLEARLEAERAERRAAAAQASAAEAREALAERARAAAAADLERLRRERASAHRESERAAGEPAESRRREAVAAASAAASTVPGAPIPAATPVPPAPASAVPASPSAAMPGAPAASGPHVLRPTWAGDEAVVLDMSPPAGTVLRAGHVTPIRFRLRARLFSRDQAWLTVTTLQTDGSVTRCDDPAAGAGRPTDGGRVLLKRGEQEVVVTVEWRGGVPVPGSERRGLLLPSLVLWQATGSPALGPRFAYLGYAPEACLAFAP